MKMQIGPELSYILQIIWLMLIIDRLQPKEQAKTQTENRMRKYSYYSFLVKH